MTSSDSPAASPRAVLAGHGDFAAGMASAVAQITGVSDVFELLSNRELTGEDILARLRAAVDDHGVRVIFTDLPAGSCTFAARRLQRERPDVILVTGANLPTLLDFVFAPAEAPVADAVDKGRAALALTAPGARGAA